MLSTEKVDVTKKVAGCYHLGNGMLLSGKVDLIIWGRCYHPRRERLSSGAKCYHLGKGLLSSKRGDDGMGVVIFGHK